MHSKQVRFSGSRLSQMSTQQLGAQLYTIISAADNISFIVHDWFWVYDPLLSGLTCDPTAARRIVQCCQVEVVRHLRLIWAR